MSADVSTRLPQAAPIFVRTSAAGVLTVWLLVSVGGAENPGFKQYEQYLSALSATGTQDPGWGRAALILAGMAILITIPLLGAWRPLLGLTSALAGAAAIGMAAYPMHCPTGARFCTASPADPMTTDVAHTAAVLLFAMAVLATVLAGARQCLAGSGASPRLWPALPVAVTVVLVAAPSLLAVTGLLQRLLLLLAQVVMVGLAAVAAAELQRRARSAAKARAEHMSRITRPATA